MQPRRGDQGGRARTDGGGGRAVPLGGVAMGRAAGDDAASGIARPGGADGPAGARAPGDAGCPTRGGRCRRRWPRARGPRGRGRAHHRSRSRWRWRPRRTGQVIVVVPQREAAERVARGLRAARAPRWRSGPVTGRPRPAVRRSSAVAQRCSRLRPSSRRSWWSTSTTRCSRASPRRRGTPERSRSSAPGGPACRACWCRRARRSRPSWPSEPTAGRRCGRVPVPAAPATPTVELPLAAERVSQRDAPQRVGAADGDRPPG